MMVCGAIFFIIFYYVKDDLSAALLLVYYSELLDYCADDGFHAGCVDGEILLMQEAFYGRMEFGTCVKYAVGMNCRRYMRWYQF